MKKKLINKIDEEEKIDNTIKEDLPNENIQLNNNEKIERFYIYIVTFNTASYNFLNTKEELRLLNNLLFPKEVKELYESKGPPTFYIIGLQEIVKLNTSNILYSL